MRNQLPIIADVEGLGKIVETASDFYSQLKQLKSVGAKLISPRDEAYARLQTRGKEDIGKSYGTRTSAGFEYAKDQLPILQLKSRLLNPRLARQAVEANRAGNYFHTASTKEYEQSLKQAEKDKSKEPTGRSVIILPSRNNFTISDRENWEIYQAILKDQAKPYFELNGPMIVYPINAKTVDSQDRTLLTQLWFRSLDDRSELYGYDRYLNDVNWLRGVSRTGEASSQKFSTTASGDYNQRQIKNYLKILQGVREGNLPASKLEEVAGFLGTLRG